MDTAVVYSMSSIWLGGELDDYDYFDLCDITINRSHLGPSTKLLFSSLMMILNSMANNFLPEISDSRQRREQRPYKNKNLIFRARSCETPETQAH